MDQATLLSILGGLYDKLVADVAARVADQAAAEWATRLSNAANFDEAIDARIKNWVALNFDDCANAWAEDSFDSLAENWAENNLDLEDVAREALQNSDHLADLIRETVRSDLTFSISVD